jgi:hypothetical protein
MTQSKNSLARTQNKNSNSSVRYFQLKSLNQDKIKSQPLAAGKLQTKTRTNNTLACKT